MLLLEVSISFHISLPHTIILFLLPPVSTYYLGFSFILKNRGGLKLPQPWSWVQIPLLSSAELWTSCVRGHTLRQPEPLASPRQGLQVA